MVRALIDNFLQYLRYERNRSELTVKAYSMDLEMFRNYIKAQDEGALRAIAHEALARNAGARGLRAIIEGIMKNVMYEVPSRDNVEKCIVTADVVTKHKDPKLLLKQEDNDTRKNA